MHTNWCVLIEISMEIGMLNFWLGLLVTAGQIISRIYLSLPNAYTLVCFDRNINGNMNVKFLIGIIGHCKKLTLEAEKDFTLEFRKQNLRHIL